MAFFRRTNTRRVQPAQRSSQTRPLVRRGAAARNSRVTHAPETPAQVSRNTFASMVRQRFFADYDWGRFRITCVFCFFGLAFLALWFRAWQLQMMEGPNLAEKARRQHTTSEMVTGKRGMILDRNGRVMARSVEVFSVYAKPAEISDYLTVANTLGPLLGLAPQELFDRLSSTRRHFLWIKRKIDDYTAEAIRKARLPGIGLSKEYERVYPFKHMAGQLLGFVGFDDNGLEGLERSLDKNLGCMPTRQIMQRDAMGRPIEWLVSAGMLNRVYNVSKMEHPLSSFDKLDQFKLFVFDTGLLKHMAGIDNSAILLKSSYQFKGALTENYILQQLQGQFEIAPRYYSDKNSEIDFVLQNGTDIIPVEVKAGEDKSAPSFKRYVAENHPAAALRFSKRGYRKDGDITNLPLYLVCKTRDLL